MPTYEITYRPATGRAPELVEADAVSVEGSGHVVLRRVVLVIGQPREVVVRRLTGAEVLSVDERGTPPK